MKIEFAPILNIHDQPIAVLVSVQPHALHDDALIRQLENTVADFDGLHVVLCAPGVGGELKVHGDPHIVRQLREKISAWELLPWMTADLN